MWQCCDVSRWLLIPGAAMEKSLDAHPQIALRYVIIVQSFYGVRSCVMNGKGKSPIVNSAVSALSAEMSTEP